VQKQALKDKICNIQEIVVL